MSVPLSVVVVEKQKPNKFYMYIILLMYSYTQWARPNGCLCFCQIFLLPYNYCDQCARYVIMCFPLCRLGTAARGLESRHEYVRVVIHDVSRSIMHTCTHWVWINKSIYGPNH